MKQYHQLLEDILKNGESRTDRTGVGTISVFGRQMRFDLSDGFPAITTKKLAWRAVVSELLWFLEGSGDERRLREILHGDRNSEKSTIWTANADASYWAPKSKFAGDLGRVYGVQWRHWRKHTPRELGTYNDSFGNTYRRTGTTQVSEVDQITNLIAGIKADPHSRRHILTAYNVGELDQMALPPCHCFAQFYVSSVNKLSCQVYIRSNDMFLGNPFNVASYALLTHMIAQVCELVPGELIMTIGDAHIYQDHVEQVREQLSRHEYDLPQLSLNPSIKDINGFTMDDIRLENYQSHGAIAAKMAV